MRKSTGRAAAATAVRGARGAECAGVEHTPVERAGKGETRCCGCAWGGLLTWQNSWKTTMRFICFMPPCRARSGTPGRSLRNASWKKRTCHAANHRCPKETAPHAASGCVSPRGACCAQAVLPDAGSTAAADGGGGGGAARPPCSDPDPLASRRATYRANDTRTPRQLRHALTLTCLQVERKTMVLLARCVLTNDHKVSIFCSAPTTATACKEIARAPQHHVPVARTAVRGRDA